MKFYNMQNYNKTKRIISESTVKRHCFMAVTLANKWIYEQNTPIYENELFAKTSHNKTKIG